MTGTGRYRLVPHGTTQWIVQGRWLLWWRDIGHWIGQETWEPYVFESEAEGRKWASDTAQIVSDQLARKRTERDRKRSTLPIEL